MTSSPLCQRESESPRRFRLRASWYRLLGFSLGLIICLTSLPAQEPSRAKTRVLPEKAEEYKVKAHMIMLLARYVTWPTNIQPGPKQAVVIGILGEDPFGEEMDKIAKKKGNTSFFYEIRRLETELDWSKCHIIFISQSEEKNQAEHLQKLKNLPILTIGETGKFVEQGGIIQFLKRGNKLRFNLNLEQARTANLKIQAKLLSIASSVKRGKGNK